MITAESKVTVYESPSMAYNELGKAQEILTSKFQMTWNMVNLNIEKNRSFIYLISVLH